MRSQQGIALITILIVVVLATILAASMAKRQAHTASNTQYLLRQNQALWYAKSAEGFAIELLNNDREQAGNIDHLQESWAQPLPSFPVEDGSVSGQVIDESGKFNLNSLVGSDDVVNETAKRWFEQLLVRLDLPPQLSEAVIDWQDTNHETTGNMGAESDYYLSLSAGYAAPNQPFHQAEQLKLVRGFEDQKYQRVLPYVTALPERNTRVNINTAPALLLASLSPELKPEQISQMQQTRQANISPFEDVESLWQQAEFAQLPSEQQNQWNSVLGVQSQFFQVQALVSLNQRQRYLTSQVWRRQDKTVVYGRSLLPFDMPKTTTTMALADAVKQQN